MKSHSILILSVIFSLFCISCDDDNDNDEFITPQGIVMLSQQILTNNESDFEIYFRVNPSNYEVTPESIALDCISSNTIGRSISITPPENLEIVSVKALTNQEGETLEGEWVATVKIKEGHPFVELTHIFLVLTYNDEKNQSISITSSNYVEIMTAPAISDKMVSFSNPMVQSYKSPISKEALSSRIHITPNLLNETTYITYDLSLIQDMTINLKGEFADDFEVFKTKDYYGLAFDITPIASNIDAYFTRHPEADAIPVSAEVTLTDVLGNTLVHRVDVSFFRSIQIIPATEKLTYTQAEFTKFPMDEFTIDVSEFLPKIGITQEFLANHPNRAFSVTCTGYGTDGEESVYGFGFTDTQDDADGYMTTGKFRAKLDILGAQGYQSGSLYAVLRFTIMNPITRDFMICADVRQEIKLVD